MQLHDIEQIEIEKAIAEMRKMNAETKLFTQEIRFAPWKLVIGGFATGVGTVALLLTLAKLAGIINV